MELTQEQIKAVVQGKPVTITVDQTECVLLQKDVYNQLKRRVYDDSDPSPEELAILAAEAAENLDAMGEIKP